MSSLDNSNNEDNPTKDETNRGQEITNMDEASKENSPVEKILECMLMCCKECEKRYSDERVPRNLSCGHTMCTECLDKCLSDQKQCPECREKQLAKSALHLPINYPLLRVIRSILNKEIDVKDIIMPEIPVHEPVCDKYQDGGQCPVHSSPLVFLCVSCSMWVCQDCLVVDHPYLPRGSCKILNLKNAMDDIKREYKRKVELSNSDVESIHQKFESVVDKNKMCSKFECCGERGHLRLVQEIDSGIENLKREAETTVMKFRNRLNELSETVDKTLSQKVLTSSCEELMVSLAKFKAYVDAEKERSSPVNQNIYIHFRMDLKHTVTKDKHVYAVHEVLGKTRYSRISCKEERLIMYSLKDDVPPPESVIIPYISFKEFLPKDNPTVFFEVGTSEETFGRVYIKLDCESPCTKQTCLLCIGENGPCYRSTCFYEYDKQLGFLKGGDYQNNDGTGGEAIVNGVERSFPHRTDIIGAFALDYEHRAKFYFCITDTPSTCGVVIGFVNYGIEYLVKASHVQPVSTVFVKDCGLFIPMPRIDDGIFSEDF